MQWIFLVRIHQTNIVKFWESIKHRTRKWAQGYYMPVLRPGHVRNISDQRQTNVTISIFWGNTSVIDNQFICANTDKCYFANLVTVQHSIKPIAVF